MKEQVPSKEEAKSRFLVKGFLILVTIILMLVFFSSLFEEGFSRDTATILFVLILLIILDFIILPKEAL